jgi:diguanylate cyclase (GGDEF)-like protein/PAS domain S-box-containing protein
MLHVGNPGASGGISIGDQGCFKQLFELSPDPTWIIYGNRFVECNEAAIRTLGYQNRDELLNVHPSKLSPPRQPDGEDSYAKAERMMAIAKDKGLHRFEWVHTKANRTDFFAEVTLAEIQLSDRQVIYCVWRDISERKQAETALRESHDRYSNLVEETADLITSVDVEGRFVFVNRSAQTVFGLAPPQCIGLSAFDFVHPQDRQTTQEAFRQWVECPKQKLSFENRQVSRSGTEHVMHWSVVARHAPTGEVCGFDGVARDITERKRLDQQMRELAFYDSLTQLPNRRLLDDRLSQALIESKRSKCYGALIFLDLDNFKALNDKHGHAVGDLLLVQAAKRMKSCVREVDTVARHGGDEFVVMMSDLDEDRAASTTQAGGIAEKIRAALAEPYLLAVESGAQTDALVEHYCTASIGLVVFIDSEGTQDDFLRLADTAMYQAKNAGSNLIRLSEVM